MNVRELRDALENILGEMRGMIDGSERENRDFKPEEQSKYEGLKAQAESLKARIKRSEEMPAPDPNPNRAPAFLRGGLGDTFAKGMAHYLRTGDTGGVRSMLSSEDAAENRGRPEVEVRVPMRGQVEERATDELMNVAAAADGQAAVPTGLVQRIAARRAEIALPQLLGCELVPGRGTTVTYPYENADAAVFAATSEQVDNLSNTYERDRPTLAAASLTLAKKTKKIQLTEELLDDEDANILAFIADHIGRAQALTLNTLMITEAYTTGTKVTFGAVTLAAGDPEKFAYHVTTGFYLDDSGSNAWVMRPPTFGAIKNLTGNARLYDETAMRGARRTLLEYPVYYSSAAAAVAASAKSVYFGNWRFMAYRLDPAMRFIRDPYTTDGIVILKYSFRTVFKLLIAGAVDYGEHPSA